MTDKDIIVELQAGCKLLKQERYKFLEKNGKLEVLVAFYLEGIEKSHERIKELEAEKDLLRKDLIKYGVHNYCPGEKCTCGFDLVKEQALKG